MKQLLKRIVKALAYLGAGTVILLAVLVGLFRLLLPKLPEYQDNIKAWANESIGLEVEFDGMNARWRLSGPELNFYNAELTAPGATESLLEAGEVSVGVGLMRLLMDRKLIVDRVLVRQTTLNIETTEAGGFTVQGLPLEDLSGLFQGGSGGTGNVEVIGQDITVTFTQVEQEDISAFDIDLIEVSRDDEALRIEASLDLPPELGSRLDLSADQWVRDTGPPIWQLYIEGRSLGLPAWSSLYAGDMAKFLAGSADLSLWLEFTRDGLDKATANLAVDDIVVAGAEEKLPFDLDGRIEYSRTDSGWLLAAQKFSVNTVENDWPESSIQAQVDTGSDGEIVAVVANASFLNLADLAYAEIWFPDTLRTIYETYQPSGEVLNLRADIGGLGSSEYRFDVSAELVESGLLASGDYPGMRGFTGSVRANRSGGRIEIGSSNLRIDLSRFIPEPLILDDAIGTVIWRRSTDGITVLSDSVQLRNADFDSESSLQITLPADGTSPDVDLESRWNINDIASARRFLPERVISPALHGWLNNALVSGVVTNGTTRLVGPLDKFPFDGGEGQFRIDARLENSILRYDNNWPDASFRSLDIVVDGTHLYSRRNTALTAGNSVADATIEIADLRNPVLTIDAFATGSLESIRNFSLGSPIAAVFGGHLDRVQVSGDASFNLQLTFPIKDRKNYEFTTRIQASDGTLSIAGFAPRITELSGVVTVSRDDISAESLFGRFLGDQVTIELSPAGDDMSAYSVIAEVAGRAGASGFAEGFGIPLGDYVNGSTDYTASIRFPRGGLERPVPMQIAISSNLTGLGIDLPTPLSKAPELETAIAAVIEFPEDGHIATNGSLDDILMWSADFRSDESGWDFDRGVLAAGGVYPEQPESRGLHIQGQTGEIRLQDWLDLARNDREGAGIGDRIRSIDLSVDDLYLFGQHLVDHRVVVDRGGNEWVVRIDGAQAAGTVTVPYDLRGERPIALDMETLILPGGDSGGESRDIDPRALPAVSVRAAEFALGQRFLGTLEADFRHTADGLRATGIKSTDASFTVEGDAGWIVDRLSEAGQRSYLTASLVSTNVERTMQRLDYQPGIDSEDMRIDIDVSWPGGPREDFVDRMAGEFRVSLGSGQLIEVDPGAGRMFGLMSVVALPRRLSLDFRDVLEKGFGFDEITGTFRVDQGDAYTCDLSLKGPAADIGIVGRAGLASRDYNQVALVSANVGATLPVVGAVVAGPQVAAALLIFSQIFKKPLQEMGQIYYGIDGSFDDPTVEVSDARRFAAVGELAGCFANAE